MTLKGFKTRTIRKSIEELETQILELKNILNIALIHYMENQYPPNPSEDFKYMIKIGKKIQITEKIIERKLKSEE